MAQGVVGEKVTMDWGDIILVAVSGLVGVVGAVVGAIANNHFSRQQMKEVWAEEERRRKSDRRRELLERDLKTVSDSLHGVMDLVAGGWRKEMPQFRFRLIQEGYIMLWKARLVISSLNDPELAERERQLETSFRAWRDLLDLDSGKVKEGKGEESSKHRLETQQAASRTLRRIREILQEV